MASAARRHWVLLTLLVVAWGLRVALCFGGGQFYWPDEMRYMRAKILVELLRTSPAHALDWWLTYPEHNFFMLISAVPLLVERAVGGHFGVVPERVPGALIVPGLAYFPGADAVAWHLPVLFLLLASVASVALSYGIARRAGGSEREGLIAAALMTCATTMLYYSRHILPYDAALALTLLALWVGIDEHGRARRSFAAGIVASLAFMTYNSYWILVAVALALPFFVHRVSIARAVTRGVAAAGGFVLIPALVVLLGRARGKDVIGNLARFSTTVTQGDFDDGWRLPFAYLWETEHGLLLVWCLSALAVVVLAYQGSAAARRRGLVWLAAAAAIYLFLGVGSNVLGRFVVYGRLVRQVVPFLCLAAASVLAQVDVRSRWQRGLAVLGVLALAVQVLANFAAPVRQRFPAEVQRQLTRTYGPLAKDTTVAGVWLVVDGKWQQSDPARAQARYVLLNAEFFNPFTAATKPVPSGVVLYRTRHPIQYPPYLYEGFTRAERTFLRAQDVSIRLVDRRPDGG